MTQSPELTEFYQAYVAWLDEGSSKSSIFSKNHGLCYCLNQFFKFKGYDITGLIDLTLEMQVQFDEARLDPMYPFNQGYHRFYQEEGENKHLNLIRVKWVHDHAKGS